MSGLLTSFDVGVTGLRSAQVGVNTTSHNLANVNTQGFSRQRVNYGDKTYNTIGASHISQNQVGLGVEINRISQVRNVFFDKSYRLELGREKFYEMQSNAIDEVESLLGEMEGVEFQDTIKDVWAAIEELVKEPDSLVKRTAVVNTCNTFMIRAQDIYSQLEDYQKNLNIQIRDSVKRINEIGDEIFDLNKRIVTAEVGGEIANDYRDQRNVLLDELSEYASISYYEDLEGRVLVNLEGNMFVSQDFAFDLKTQELEDNNLLDVVWSENEPVFNLDQGFSSNINTDVGKLKGLLFARGDGAKNYSDIPLTYTDDVSDPNYSNYANIDIYEAVMREYNNTTNSSVIASTMAYFDKLIHATVTAINDAICPNDTVENVMNNLGYGDLGIKGITLADGSLVDVSQWDDLLIFDEYHAGVGNDADATAGEEIFKRQSVERYTEATITFGDGSTKQIKIYNQEQTKDLTKNITGGDVGGDTFTLYTVSQLVINQNMLDNPSIMGLSGNNYQGNIDGYDVNACERLSKAWQLEAYKVDPNTATLYNLVDYYDTMVGNIATLGKQYKSTYETQSMLVDSIDSNRSSVAGVSSDEELTNLIQYSYAYTANSKYITTVDQMLEDLLNKLG